jgi:hypothetical protein
MQAHYAEAVPLDVLKTEMSRLTRAMTAAERQVEASRKHVAEIDDVLDKPLVAAAPCHSQYGRAPDNVKRQINQGFFEKLWIEPDGSVGRYELTEPFAALLRQPGHVPTGAGGRGWNSVQEGVEAGQADLGTYDNTPASVRDRGVYETCLVELRGIEPLTYSMRTSRATNCATAPVPAPNGRGEP